MFACCFHFTTLTDGFFAAAITLLKGQEVCRVAIRRAAWLGGSGRCLGVPDQDRSVEQQSRE
jgi:hypothetical protein